MIPNRISPTLCTQKPIIIQRLKVLFFVLSTFLLLTAGCVIPPDIVANTGQGAVSRSPHSASPVIAVSPLEITPETEVTVSGAGWQPNDLIGLWAESSDGSQTVGIASVTADIAGNFTIAFQYPANALVEIAGIATTNQILMTARSTTNQDVALATLFANGELANSPATLPATPTSIVVPTATYAPPTVAPASIQIADTTIVEEVAVVTSPGLNIRNGPSASYPILTDVLYGTQLLVLGQSANGAWLRIQHGDGTVGWVARIYTTFGGTSTIVVPQLPLQSPPTAPPVVVITDPTTDWRGEYYANRDLSGAPVRVSNDTNIDFNWGEGGPSGLPGDNFSIRWTRSVYFDSDEYRFRVRMDDGIRLFVDDNLVIEDWRDNSARDRTGDIWLGSGNHTIRVEYYEHTGAAEVHVWWERKPDEPQTDNDDEFPEWKGEYFTNRDLDGNPRFRRNDERISFNWGTGSPSSRIPDHDFSVRWSRWIYLDPGRYRFNARSDDGVRVYVNGDRVINEWNDNSADRVFSAERDLAGGTDLRVDYYERRGGARIEFWWERVDVVIPPTATPVIATATPIPDATNTPIPPPSATPTVTPVPIQPSANVEPSSGGLGTLLSVNGGAFPPETVVNVHLAALAGVQAAGAHQAIYASTTTDRTGSYSVAFPMPENWINGGPITSGKILIIVATDGFTQQASDDFEYVAALPTPTPIDTPIPTMTPLPTSTPLPEATNTPVPQPFVNISPGSGGPETLVSVSGGGFPAGTPLGLYLGLFDGAVDPTNTATNYASTLTDRDGNFTMSFNMPATVGDGVAVPSGSIIVLVATGDLELQTTAIFDYTAPPPAEGASAQEEGGAAEGTDSSGE